MKRDEIIWRILDITHPVGQGRPCNLDISTGFYQIDTEEECIRLFREYKKYEEAYKAWAKVNNELRDKRDLEKARLSLLPLKDLKKIYLNLLTKEL